MEIQFVLNWAVCKSSEINQATQLCPGICVQAVSFHEGKSVKPVAPEEQSTSHAEHNVLLLQINIQLNLHILKIALKIIIGCHPSISSP